MSEFWEENFAGKQEMWGLEPAQSARVAGDLFREKGVKSVLIPGIGYGRNARVFRESGIEVTGIEISETAIGLARKHFGTGMVIHHGSVTDMPFDNRLYDGIFCYGLVHLLDTAERAKLIADCYNQLEENGYMVFTAITKDAPTYGQGTPVGEDRFEMFGGVKMFFYDRISVEKEFAKAGLFEITEITESYPFYLIQCRKAKPGF
ncbi:MAG: class I SAM-dependent methyltransferase [Leadbetterella sp.]|nr:class I SAM-dependent methyltransferase [Leadbetterella sp.]